MMTFRVNGFLLTCPRWAVAKVELRGGIPFWMVVKWASGGDGDVQPWSCLRILLERPNRHSFQKERGYREAYRCWEWADL